MNTTVQLYKLKTTPPTGRRLYTYMAAILEVTGMDNGKTFPIKKFLGNIKTHIDEARIISVEGGYQLTPKGRDFFADRYSLTSPQNIDRAEVEAMIRGITSGNGLGVWEPIK